MEELAIKIKNKRTSGQSGQWNTMQALKLCYPRYLFTFRNSHDTHFREKARAKLYIHLIFIVYTCLLYLLLKVSFLPSFQQLDRYADCPLCVSQQQTQVMAKRGQKGTQAKTHFGLILPRVTL